MKKRTHEPRQRPHGTHAHHRHKFLRREAFTNRQERPNVLFAGDARRDFDDVRLFSIGRAGDFDQLRRGGRVA